MAISLSKAICYSKQGGCGYVFYVDFKAWDQDDPNQPCPECGGTECWGYDGERIEYHPVDLHSASFEVCDWKYHSDDYSDYYSSSCGEDWQLVDGSPEDNNVRFCQGCGKKIKIVELSDD